MASIWDDLQRKARGAATLVKAASAAGDAAFEAERKKYAEAAWRLEHPGQEPPKGPALQAPRESPMRRWIRKGATAAADALTTPGSASNQQFAEGFETIGELLAPSDPESGLPNVDFGSKAVVPLAVKLNRRRAIQKTAEALAPGAVIERAASTPKGEEHIKFLKDVHFEDLTFPKYETPGAAAPIDRKVTSRDSYFHATRFSTVPDIVASRQIGKLGQFGKKPKKTEKTLDYFSATDAQKVWEKLGEPNMTFIPFTHSHSYQKFVDTAKELGYVVKKDYPADAHYSFWKPAGVESTTAGVSLGRVNKIKSTIPRDVVFELDRGAMRRAGVPTRPYVESGFEKMKKPSYNPNYAPAIVSAKNSPDSFVENFKKIVANSLSHEWDTVKVVHPILYDENLSSAEKVNELTNLFEKEPGHFLNNFQGKVDLYGGPDSGYDITVKVSGPKLPKPSSHPSAGFEYEERTFKQGIPLKGTVRRAFVNLDEIKNRGFSEEELRRNIEPLFSLTDDVRGYRTPGHGSTELHRILPSHVLTEGSRYALPRAKNFDDFKDILSGTLSTFKQSKDPVSGRKILEKSKSVGVPKAYEPWGPQGDTVPGWHKPEMQWMEDESLVGMFEESNNFMETLKQKLIAKGHVGPGLSNDADTAASQPYLNVFAPFFEGEFKNLPVEGKLNKLHQKLVANPSLSKSLGINILKSPGGATNLYISSKSPKAADVLDAGMKEHLELADVQEYDLGPEDFLDPEHSEFDEDDLDPIKSELNELNNLELADVHVKGGYPSFGYNDYLKYKGDPDAFVEDIMDKYGYDPGAAMDLQKSLWKMHAPKSPLEKLGMKVKDLWKTK